MRRRMSVFAIVVAMLSLLFGAPAAASNASAADGYSGTVTGRWTAQTEYAKGKAYFFNVYGSAYLADGQAVYYLQKLTLSTESTATQTAYFNVYDINTDKRLWPNDNSGPGYSVDWRETTQNTIDAWFKLPASHRLYVTYSTTEGAHGDVGLGIA